MVVLALAGVPTDRVDPEDLSRSRAERALTSLKISTLARDLERLEGQFNANCERYRGARLPNLCSAYAEALDGIAQRSDELYGEGEVRPGIQVRLDRCVDQPLKVARLRLDEIETHTLLVNELLQVQRSMREGLRRGDALSAMAVYNSQRTEGISDFSPDLLLDLLADLDELAFQATHFREPGLRDHRIY
jgi:hypothetical protein